MKIKKVVCAAGKTGFYFDDQRAIKRGAVSDGAFYSGEVVTEGFTSVRQAGESISVLFILEDGQIAHGDCAAVQCYGVTQACLDAVAKSQHKLMAQVIAKEYNTKIADKMIPIFTQSGDDRYVNADKMIMKGAEVLPHALFNHVEQKTGLKGEKLRAYIEWLRNRVIEKRTCESYNPIFHIDVYGTLGVVFDNDFKKIAEYIADLAEVAKPFHLRIEGPVDVEEKQAQIKALHAIRQHMDEMGCSAEIVADEWCNTLEDIIDFSKEKAGHMAQIKTPDLGGINNAIEAVLYCQQHGMGAYLGGTCNETNRSAEICAHIAMATSPDQMLAKPGMGVDEGYMLVYNEMSRIIALKDII